MLATLLDSTGTLCLPNRALSGRALSLDANDVQEGTRPLVQTVTTGRLDLHPLRPEDRENSSHAHKQDIGAATRWSPKGTDLPPS
jgi:hypothetical protein